MICTFCGTENPQGNRFCGMCGVRLERRTLERRTEQRDSTACPDCGHVNEPKYKFCGMCGAKVDRRMQERRGSVEPVRANAAANAQLPTPEVRRPTIRREPGNGRTSTATLTAPPSTDEEQARFNAARRDTQVVPASVAGPSFLGLNDPQADTDYLLEDERSSHRGLRALLLLIVLAAIVGLIFVQYRSSLNKNPQSPRPPNPNPATIPQSEGRSRSPAQDDGLKTAVAAHSLLPAVAGLAKAATLGPNTASAKSTEEDNDPPDNQVAQSKPDPDSERMNEEPSPTLIKARQYLHGQGVRQNCEQGLIYLRAAARDNDPQAAVQMGALYSSGLCVVQDRVKAYQWFATARQMQPDNHWISKNLNELWAQMSPQERRQIHQ